MCTGTRERVYVRSGTKIQIPMHTHTHTIHAYVHTDVCVGVCESECMCVRACVCECVCVHLFVCASVCALLCMYNIHTHVIFCACVHVYNMRPNTYTHTHTHAHLIPFGEFAVTLEVGISESIVKEKAIYHHFCRD